MPATNRLCLVEGWVDGILSNGFGIEDEAEFGVVATVEGERGAGQYKLTAMSPRRFEAWYLASLERGLAEGEARPLMVPGAVLAVTGLVEHVTQEYLDPETPDRINIISACLEGPIEA